MPTCMAYSSRRWEVARRTPGRHRECLFPTAEGPFPYAKGAFTAFSIATARVILAHIDEDEAYVRTNRSQIPLVRPDYDKLYPVDHKKHPKNLVLLEDVYYCYLVFRELNASSVALVNMPISEYVKERAQKNRFPFPSRAHVYHKLRHPARFEYLLREPSYLRMDDQKAPRCTPMHTRYRPTAALTHCCEQWMYCSYWPGATSSVHADPQFGTAIADIPSYNISIDELVRRRAGVEAQNARFDERERAGHILELRDELASVRGSLRLCSTTRMGCSSLFKSKLMGRLADIEAEWESIGHPQRDATGGVVHIDRQLISNAVPVG